MPFGGIFDFEAKSQRLEEVNGLLEDPKVWDDNAKSQKLGKEKRELEGMEAAIVAVETRVHDLENTLNDPVFHASRSREARGLIAELETARAEVTRLFDRWQELAARASELRTPPS